MTKSKLVTDNQGREVSRLARDIGLPRSNFQAALTDGRVDEFLRGLLPKPLSYPDFVREHLTPEYEVKELADPGAVELWPDPRQERDDPSPVGHEVYEATKRENLLPRALSFGHLKWYEANPDRIPPDFHGKVVDGRASVVQSTSGELFVPCLCCDVDRPYVHWCWLGSRWFMYGGGGPAGLRKETSTS